MKKLIPILLALFYSLNIQAQTEGKIIVGIVPMRYHQAAHKAQAAQLNDLVMRAFSENKRLTLLDRGSVAQIQKELDLQKNIEYTDGITVQQNKAYGAEVLVIGTLTNIDVQKNTVDASKIMKKIGLADTTKSVTYKCELSFTMQAFDMETGKMIDNKVVNMSSQDGSSMSFDVYKKEGDPMKNAIRANQAKILEAIKVWVNSMYPPVLQIVKIEEKTKKGLPKKITITSEEKIILKVGDIVSVNEITESEFQGRHKRRVVEIASLSVAELQGDFFLCDVETGQDVLEEKMSKSVLQLLVSDKKRPWYKPKL